MPTLIGSLLADGVAEEELLGLALALELEPEQPAIREKHMSIASVNARIRVFFISYKSSF
ncbi:hypothetical protein SDC9_122778 [bioreactor metagenome]|uniref:Uncharacterized protein n=1 Tax=bioreactor metagenome TaxID=1076179 RepID=A0A645CFR8_9ZZZZ